MSKKVKKKMADVFEFPPDVVMDLHRITVIGNIQVYVENHRGITLYTDTAVKISVNGGEVVIKGNGLRLRTVYSDDIYVEGTITEINLEGLDGQ